MKKLFIIFPILMFVLQMSARQFVHPGLLHTTEDLARIRNLVDKRLWPSTGSYEILKADRKSQADYQMQGPFENIARAGEYGFTKTPCEEDFNAAYYNALMWNITKKEEHARKTMEIIRAYAKTTQKIYGPDDPLCAGLQGFIFVNAAELMRYTYPADKFSDGWNVIDTKHVERLLRQVFYPVLDTFVHAHPYANGNWGQSVYKMLMGMAVFLDDEVMFQQALDLFDHGNDNGALPNYIAESGQLQESGRDQAHTMLGIGCLSEMAEVAWKQGIDLYASYGNRIMKGMEYLSKYNLGYDVPFKTWTDKTGRYNNWTTLGESGRGEFRSVFELAYNHYVYRRHLQMPYTKQVLGLIRPEWQGFTCDNPGFGSLLFYLGKGIPKTVEGKIDENLLMAWKGWQTASVGWQVKKGKLKLSLPSLCLYKKVTYDSGNYPLVAVKVSKMPRHHKSNWFRMSYSVNSAPEYWAWNGLYAKRVGKDIYVFDVQNALSNNGTVFSGKKQQVTLILDFGETANDGVVVDWIKSISSLDDLRKN